MAIARFKFRELEAARDAELEALRELCAIPGDFTKSDLLGIYGNLIPVLGHTLDRETREEIDRLAKGYVEARSGSWTSFQRLVQQAADSVGN